MDADHPSNRPGATAPVLQRARGRLRVGFRRSEDGKTRVSELFQEGCLKVRLPRSPRDGEAELVLMNIAGGLTGGDRVLVEVDVGEGARATITTPACEYVYRSIGGEAVIDQRLQVGRGARLDWLPQETILFDRGRVRRRFDVELEADAEVTIAEAVLFGRAAMGETVKEGLFSDFWTVRRGGSLMFADAVRVVGHLDQVLACRTTLDGHAAMASLLHVGKGLTARRDALRAEFAADGEALVGVSVVGEVLVARIVTPGGRALRQAMVRALASLRDARPLPRLWFC